MSIRHVVRSVRCHRPLVVAAMTAGALTVTASVAVAEPVQRSGTDVVTHQQAVNDAERQAVLDYWTPERIAELTEPSSDNPPKSGADGAPWSQRDTGSGTLGRLFFTDHGEDASCTATVVDSEGGDTVVTAGHCVNNTDLLGEDNQWTKNVMFIPGYRDGEAPYGKFTGRLGVAAKTWLQNDQQHATTYDPYDQAFVVLNGDEHGRSAQDTVGAAQRIGFDQPGDRDVHEFGYPRAASDPAREGLPEYTGERLAYCDGRAHEVIGNADHPSAEDIWGVECVMGGGASGGPRIADLDPETGLGTVVGDNTQSAQLDDAGNNCGYVDPGPDCTRHLVGPRFTSAITEPLFERAQHAAG